MPGGHAARLAEAAGLRVVSEAFADRGYRPDGSLVPRGQPGAVRSEPAEVAAQAVGIVTRGMVACDDGSQVPVVAESICVHGDTAGAVALAAAVRGALEQAGVTLAPFV